MIMGGDQERSSWQKRYEAGAARERAENANWVQGRFGVPLHRTLLRELPWVLGLFFFGYLTQGWVWGVVGAAAVLTVTLGFRAWARRHYGVTTEQPPESS